MGRLIRVHEPLTSTSLPETARYTYDTMGRMTQAGMRKADGSYTQTRTFVYNTQGQLTSATNPENGTVTYTYRSDGLLATKTDAKNQTLTYSYDDTTHKLTTIQGGYQTTSFRYGNPSDPAGWKANGRLVSATNTDANGANPYTWWYAYDSMGRVSKQTLVTPQAWPVYPYGYYALQAQYTFDADGRMTQMKYPGTMQNWNNNSQPTDNLNTDGKLYGYAYNILGHQTSTQSYTECYDPEIGYYPCWQTLAFGATYNAAGQITTWKDGSETGYTTLNRGYDPMRGWLTSSTAIGYWGTPYMNLAYSYLDNGRASTVTDNVNPAFKTTTYQYDNLNRLTQATAANTSSVTQWQLSWTYDEFGNRLTQTPLGGTPYTPPSSSLTYNQATNRITTSGYAYDANGNLTAIPGVMSMQYDIFDRVKQAGSTTYDYDAFGRRVAKTIATWNAEGTAYDYSTYVYFYDINGRLLSQNLGGWSYNNQVYFAGQRLGQWTDRLGSVRSDGGTASHYYPYGEEITSTYNNRYKFAETFRDSDTGLDYAMARYYGSGIGRFLSFDRGSADLNDPQRWNRYSYAINDPINLADPSGKDPCTTLGCVIETMGLGRGYEMGGTSSGPPSCTTFVAVEPCVPEPFNGPGPGVSEEGPAIGDKTLAKDALKAKTGNLAKDCIDAINGLDGGLGRLNTGIGDLTFWDARPSVDGSRKGSDILPGSSPKTLAELTAHDNALVLQDPAGIISNNIVLGNTFWGLPSSMQDNTLLHEALHAVFKQRDDQLVNKFGINVGSDSHSVALQKWLQNDCQNYQ